MQTDREADLGQAFMALDPSFFAPGFEDRMSDLMNHCRNMEPVSLLSTYLINIQLLIYCAVFFLVRWPIVQFTFFLYKFSIYWRVTVLNITICWLLYPPEHFPYHHLGCKLNFVLNINNLLVKFYLPKILIGQSLTLVSTGWSMEERLTPCPCTYLSYAYWPQKPMCSFNSPTHLVISLAMTYWKCNS